MLSIDELANGRTFILKLHDSAGTSMHWVQTLRGAVAKRWYEIYRTSDWDALRAEASAVFTDCMTEAQAEGKRRSARCVVIDTRAVTPDELVVASRNEGER